MDNLTDAEKAIAINAVANYRREQALQEQVNRATAYHLTLKVGDEVTFYQGYNRDAVDGIVTRRGTIAGWAMVEGVETRFEATDLIF